ncbi:MAG: hypothetical protein AAB214_11435, partial [Fibrobacterota bacterium]
MDFTLTDNANVPLAFGKNSIEIIAKDVDGALSAKIIEVFRLDQTAPVVKPKSGSDIQVGGLVTEYDLAWEVADNSGVFTASLNSKAIACADGICKATVPLATGANKFVFEAKDAMGLSTTSQVSISRTDDKAPEVAMVAPVDPALPVMVTDAEPKTVLRWTAKDNMAVSSCTANGTSVVKDDAGQYVLPIDMAGRFGDSVVTIVAKDADGNVSIAKTVTVRHPDLVPPAIALVAPAPPTTILGATDAAPKAVVRWTVSDNSGAFASTANGKDVVKSTSAEFAFEVDMTGRYVDSIVVVAAKDAAGNAAALVSVTVRHADETPPKLVAVEPAAAGGMVWVQVGLTSAVVKWKAEDAVGLASCAMNGKPIVGDESGNFNATIDMAGKSGDSLVKIVAKDKAGNVSAELVVSVRRDIAKPLVATTAPVSGIPVEALLAGTTMFTVKWSGTDAGGLASTTINGVEFAAKATGEYTLPVDMALKNGDSAIWIVAKDKAGNVSDTTKFKIHRDASPPTLVDLPTDTVFLMGNQRSFSWNAMDNEEVVWSGVNGQKIEKAESGYFEFMFEITTQGDSTLVFVAKDAAGNMATKSVIVRHDMTYPVVASTAPLKEILVEDGVSSVLLSWTVTDNDKISAASIDGETATVSGNIYSKSIAYAGSQPKVVPIMIFDRCGNSTYSTVTLVRRALKMAIGGYFGLHLDRTGSVTLWGGEGIVLPANLGKVRDIAAAGRGAFFLKGDGTIAPAGDDWPSMPTPVWPRVKRLFAGTVGWDNPTVVGILDNDSFCVAGAHVGLNFVNAAIASNTRVMKVALGTNFIILQDLDSIATSWVVTGGSTVVKAVH